MNRIDLPHLVWALENLVAGTVVNRIEVDPETERWAKVALERMLALPAPRSPAKRLTRRTAAAGHRRVRGRGHPRAAIQRLSCGSTGRSPLTRSRIWISSRLSRRCGPCGANG